jgi:hypothetical protein
MTEVGIHERLGGCELRQDDGGSKPLEASAMSTIEVEATVPH